jgi:hypothetical protein
VSVVTQVASLLNGEKVDAVICVAGGWAGGNAASKGDQWVFNIIHILCYSHIVYI